jgi:Glycosyltransferase (GlcNAc)
VVARVCRYDIFTPTENLIFHHYEREKGKSVYSDHDELWWSEEQATLVKVRFMLGLSHQPPNETLAASMQTHGLGTARSLQQYYQFAGMDPARNISHAAAKFCGPENGMPPTACLKGISQPIIEPIEQPATTEAEAAANNRTSEARRHRTLLQTQP